MGTTKGRDATGLHTPVDPVYTRSVPSEDPVNNRFLCVASPVRVYFSGKMSRSTSNTLLSEDMLLDAGTRYPLFYTVAGTRTRGGTTGRAPPKASLTTRKKTLHGPVHVCIVISRFTSARGVCHAASGGSGTRPIPQTGRTSLDQTQRCLDLSARSR